MEQLRTRRRFTVDEYEAMWRAEILTDRDRVELWDGEIVEKPVVNPPHAACVDRLTMRFAPALAGRAIVRIQSAIRLQPRWEPEPDLTLIRVRDDFYADGHPEPDDILLAVEVADTTLLWDRNTKVPLYAQLGIREAWVVDVNGKRIETYRQPTPDGYASITYAETGENVFPAAFPDLRIAVRDIVG